MAKTRIAAAGNTEIPAYLVLCEKGYSVRKDKKENGEELWYAEKADQIFVAEGPIELLGLAAMYENRGENWKATDSEVEAFMSKHEI